MKRFGVWAVILALLAGVLTGCGSDGTASNKYIEISQYDGLKIDKVDDAEVTDEMVDEEIESTLDALGENKTEVPDRPIKKGDKIVLDCSAKDKDGKVISGTELKDYELEIGSNAFIPGWEDACIGQPYGKEFTFDLKFPEGYGSEEISGKNATWTVTAKGRITGRKKAKLTDKTVQKISETSTTVKEYREEVKKNLTEEREHSNRSILEQEVWDALLKKTKVKEYPKDRLEEVRDEYTDRYKEMAKQYNMSYEEFLAQGGMTEKTLKEEIDKQVKEDLKREVATELLLKELDLELSGDDYTEKYKELSKLYGYGGDDDLFVQAIGEDKAKEIAEQATISDWLIDHAKQVESKKDKAAGDSQK